MTSSTPLQTGSQTSEPRWIATPCGECGRKAETLARLGGERAGIDLCAACLGKALAMLGGAPAAAEPVPGIACGTKLAVQLAADVLAEDILRIADGEEHEPLPMTARDIIERTKLQVETRMWLCSCWNPEKYGPPQRPDFGLTEDDWLEEDA